VRLPSVGHHGDECLPERAVRAALACCGIRDDGKIPLNVETALARLATQNEAGALKDLKKLSSRRRADWILRNARFKSA